MKERQVIPGQSIKFMNEKREMQDALVSAVHGSIYYKDGKPEQFPCVNIVICSTDFNKQDAHGIQIERHSSVQHRSSNAYHEQTSGNPIGMTWQFNDEAY